MSENQGEAFKPPKETVLSRNSLTTDFVVCVNTYRTVTHKWLWHMTGSLSGKNGSVFSLAAPWELSSNYFSFLAGTSSLTEMFIGHGNLSWTALMWSPRRDEFVVRWPCPHTRRAEDGGHLLKVTLCKHANREVGSFRILPSHPHTHTVVSEAWQ